MQYPTTLLLGYGNPLRCDDGIGQIVAAQVARWQLSHLRSRALHQLAPELSEDISRVQRVVFVDARRDRPGESEERRPPVEITPLQCQTITQALGHSFTPVSLLGMTQWLYSTTPQAWLVSIAGERFEVGDRLSPAAEQSVADVLNLLGLWLASDLDFDPLMYYPSSICA